MISSSCAIGTAKWPCHTTGNKYFVVCHRMRHTAKYIYFTVCPALLHTMNFIYFVVCPIPWHTLNFIYFTVSLSMQLTTNLSLQRCRVPQNTHDGEVCRVPKVWHTTKSASPSGLFVMSHARRTLRCVYTGLRCVPQAHGEFLDSGSDLYKLLATQVSKLEDTRIYAK